MKKEMMRKVMPTALAVMMGMSAMTAYTSTANAASDDELVTITLYPPNANVASGVIDGWRGEYLASKGLRVEVWAYSDEKTNAILASGDLPDIMYVSESNYANVIEGNMLLNLDDYLDQMPNAQAFDKLQPALEYIREYKSAGTGGVYFLPLEVGAWTQQQSYETDRRNIRLNWDVYEKIGAPEINDMDELITVMGDMLEAKPTAPDGSQCYGTVLNAGSDGTYWGNMQLWYYWYGCDVTSLQYLVETDMVNATYSSILDKSSHYYDGLKWYNKVYRAGLMDPDSISIDRQTQKTKVESDTGNAMVPSGTLPGWAPNYLQYYVPGTEIYYPNNSTFGYPGVAINAKTKNVDACVKFLDLLCSPDEYMNLRSSLEGEMWEVTDEGYAQLTDKYLNCTKSGEHFTMSDGSEWQGFWLPFVCQGGENTSYTDKDGNPRSANPGQWKEIYELSYGGDRFKSWQETTGYDTWVDWAEAEGVLHRTSELSDVYTFAEQPSEEQKLTIEAIRNTVVNASWKMVYAESDEEFDEIWDQMVSDCEGLGGEELMNWRIEQLEIAKESRDQILGE